ncbi:hypothetical protein IMCC3317_11470 [Kordia antarctica]|uniref:AAA+ ATPase domain-containing protein n=1 Tax=Kordia antarctica TaxID=1218801 RepID=A0A7L4ZH89_9FLAO|nr:ATP-binding protein [Kordia antarctica]QHI35799.1 hypothetical protein IMCC3317_11470 [Kordia antarctica]
MTEIVSLENFEQQLQLYFNELEKVHDSAELIKVISHNFQKNILEKYIAIATSYNTDTVSEKEVYLASYSYPNYIKNLCILNRDVLLEFLKSAILVGEKEITAEKIATHFEESKTVLIKATTDVIDTIGTIEVSEEIISQNLKHHVSPWESYKEQFDTLKAQNESILAAFKTLKNVQQNFDTLKVLYSDIKLTNDNLLKNYMDCCDSLNETDFVENSETPTHFIDSAIEKGKHLGNSEKDQALTEKVSDVVSNFQTIKIPIESAQGDLVVREINFNRAVKKWLDYQISPLIADIYAIEDNLKVKAQLRLSSLKNTLQLKKDHKNPEFELAIRKLKSEAVSTKDAAAKEIASIEERLNENLQLSRIFQGESFLDVTLGSSIQMNQKHYLTAFKSKVNTYVSKFSNWYNDHTYEESKTALQLSTLCISERMNNKDLGQYDSLFLNKFFLGDLFLIDRPTISLEFKETVTQWNDSFAKAVLIHGTPNSGKSTFIQQMATSNFGKHIVSLAPNSIATIDGRKFTTTYDLQEALSYIKNNNIKSTRPILCIDDLELWRDKEHSILDNMRALLKFIENESNNVFIVVSCATNFMQHLDKRLPFSHYFSNLIDVSSCSKEIVSQAIIIRHETSHKTLLSPKGIAIDAKKLNAAIQRIIKFTNYNLGASLQAWAYCTIVNPSDENTIILDTDIGEFVPFFTKEEHIILKQVLTFKTISELGLKRVMSSNFNDNYNPALKRLTNTKVLLRNGSGDLFLNPVISNDVQKTYHKETS